MEDQEPGEGKELISAIFPDVQFGWGEIGNTRDVEMVSIPLPKSTTSTASQDQARDTAPEVHEFDQEQRVRINTTEFEEYFHQLTAFSMERLSREPGRLANALRVNNQQLQELAFRNYKNFLQSTESLTQAHRCVQDVDDRIKSLREHLSGLSDQCKGFSSRIADVSTQRRKQRTMLQQHSVVLEILEIPQLMDTCVRNGYYEEALELDHFARHFARAHPDIPVIVELAADVQRTTEEMEEQLMAVLRQDSKLPAFLRAVNYIRRLGTRSERDLRLGFLQCRSAWLEEQFDALSHVEPAVFLLRLTEMHRIHVFDILTHYRAIFAADSLDEITEVCPVGGKWDPRLIISPTQAEQGSPLNIWVLERISIYLAVLEQLLPRVMDGSALANLLDQASQMATALGRAGADFRSLLPPIFERVVDQHFRTSLGQALERFAMQLKAHMPTARRRTAREELAEDIATQPSGAPPAILLRHTPVAILCNGILDALNTLRVCAPVALQHELLGVMNRAMEQMVVLVMVYAQRFGAGTKKGTSKAKPTGHSTQARQHFIRLDVEDLCESTARYLIPYLYRCFNKIFPDLALGLPPGEPLTIPPLPAPETSTSEQTVQSGPPTSAWMRLAARLTPLYGDVPVPSPSPSPPHSRADGASKASMGQAKTSPGKQRVTTASAAASVPIAGAAPPVTMPPVTLGSGSGSAESLSTLSGSAGTTQLQGHTPEFSDGAPTPSATTGNGAASARPSAPAAVKAKQNADADGGADADSAATASKSVSAGRARVTDV